MAKELELILESINKNFEILQDNVKDVKKDLKQFETETNERLANTEKILFEVSNRTLSLVEKTIEIQPDLNGGLSSIRRRLDALEKRTWKCIMYWLSNLVLPVATGVSVGFLVALISNNIIS